MLSGECVCVGLGNQSITEFVVSLKTLFLLNEIRVERRRLKKNDLKFRSRDLVVCTFCLCPSVKIGFQ